MEKVSLPTKTKIAAWWMIVVGGINIVISFLGIVTNPGGDWLALLFPLIILLVAAILFVLGGFYLFRRKKWAWRMCIGILILIILVIWSITDLYGYIGVSDICESRCMYDVRPIGNQWIEFKLNQNCINRCEFLITSLFSIPFLVPILLLLLDRKNFWKIAK
jgi:hypothetical protein